MNASSDVLQSETTREQQIVILGAGYAGLTAYLTLRDRLPDQAQVTLVNDEPYHVFTTQLHAFAAGPEEDDDVRVELEHVIQDPAQLVVATVTRVNARAQQLELKGGRKLGYDLLLLAAGSEPNFFNLPGVAEAALVLNNYRSAEQLKETLQEETASATGDDPCEVVIVGGGLTGVEVAGEIADTYHDSTHIDLIQGDDRLMPELHDQLAGRAAQILRDKGVNIHTRTLVARADDRQLTLDSGKTLPYDIFVWAGGVRGSSLVDDSGLPVNKQGRGTVDTYLHATASDQIYMAGDCAAVIDPDSNSQVPMMAQLAVQEGRHAALNIAQRLQDREESVFHPNFRGTFISLGENTGIGEIGGQDIYGFPALLVKRMIETHHAYEAGGLLHILKKIFVPHHQAQHEPAREKEHALVD